MDPCSWVLRAASELLPNAAVQNDRLTEDQGRAQFRNFVELTTRLSAALDQPDAQGMEALRADYRRRFRASQPPAKLGPPRKGPPQMLRGSVLYRDDLVTVYVANSRWTRPYPGGRYPLNSAQIVWNVERDDVVFANAAYQAFVDELLVPVFASGAHFEAEFQSSVQNWTARQVADIRANAVGQLGLPYYRPINGMKLVREGDRFVIQLNDMQLGGGADRKPYRSYGELRRSYRD